jgi:hypothetical protein
MGPGVTDVSGMLGRGVMDASSITGIIAGAVDASRIDGTAASM